MQDNELIAEYVDNGSQRAFEELVNRYLPMVYACASRKVGTGDADDVAQAVFLILARKAESLRRRTDCQSLAGWMFRSTCYAAAQSLRSRQRRIQRETQAMIEQNAEIDMRADRFWAEASDRLDTIIARLGEKDREAVLLHYFAGAPHAAVGRALAVSEDAAAKRLSRAVEKLRQWLKRDGMAVDREQLESAMLTHGARPAPAAVVAACVAAGVSLDAVALGTSAAFAIAQGATQAMLLGQIKTVAALGCAAAIAAGGAAATWHAATTPPALEQVYIERLEPFGLEYRGRNVLPDGTIQFQINRTGNTRTYFAEIGDSVEGYRLQAYKEEIIDEQVPSVGRSLKRDASRLILERDGQVVTIEKGGILPNVATVAVFRVNNQLAGITAAPGDEIELHGRRYRMENLSPDGTSVALAEQSTGKRLVVRKGQGGAQ